jgi:urease accessory protein
MSVSRSFLRRAAVPAALLLAAGVASAHPGHGAPSFDGLLATLRHLLTEPDHVALLAVVVAAAWAGTRAWRSRRAGDDSQRRRQP